MMLAAAPPLPIVVTVALAALSLAAGLAFVRLVLGPTLSDRIVALDLIAVLLVGGLIVFGIGESREDSLRVATVLALLNFLGTVGFAIYVQRKTSP